MEYEVCEHRVAAQLTAVVRGRASLDALAQVVPLACGEVWNYLRASNLPRPGRNLALYLNDQIDLECGVEVFHPFTGNGRVVCSRTPAGRVASTVHRGPYERLGEAHNAVLQWCADYGYALAGPCWEIYGHGPDDPSQLRTEVFWLLRDDPVPTPPQ